MLRAGSGSGHLKGSGTRVRDGSVSASTDGGLRGSFFHIASKYGGCAGSVRGGSAGAGAGLRHSGSDDSKDGAARGGGSAGGAFGRSGNRNGDALAAAGFKTGASSVLRPLQPVAEDPDFGSTARQIRLPARPAPRAEPARKAAARIRANAKAPPSSWAGMARGCRAQLQGRRPAGRCATRDARRPSRQVAAVADTAAARPTTIRPPTRATVPETIRVSPKLNSLTGMPNKIEAAPPIAARAPTTYNNSDITPSTPSRSGLDAGPNPLLPCTFCRKGSALKVTHEHRQRYSMPSPFCRRYPVFGGTHALERALLQAALPS